jgi:hypothetical protein
MKLPLRLIALTGVAAALVTAGPAPGPVFAGLNLYDPFLASWLQGTAGQQLAEQSVTLLGTLNGIVTGAYQPPASGSRMSPPPSA